MKPAPRETFHSFLSRAARSKGVLAPEFINDASLAWRDVVKLERTAVAEVALALSLTADELAEALSWTGVPQGNVRIQFRGYDYVSRSLRNPVMRGCPCCLKENLASASDFADPTASLVMRGDWQLREASICLKHRHLLVPLWTEDAPARRFDVASRLEAILPQIGDGALERPLVNPSAYDTWLDRRLATDEDDGWLADKSPHAASTVSGLLGRQILLQDGAADGADPSISRDAYAAGYDVISLGPDAIHECFRRLSAKARGPAAAFGIMLRRFKEAYFAEPSFEPFTDILRAFIVERWPFLEDKSVLGQAFEANLFISTTEIARELGRHPSYVRNAMKVVKDREEQARSHITTADLEAVRAQADGLVSGKTMMALLGVKKHEWDALRAGGFISPRLQSEIMRKVWHPDDATALIQRLTGTHPAAWDGGSDWRRISPGAASAKVPYEDVIRAIISGEIAVSVDPRETGLAGIYVSRQKLAEMFARRG